MIAVPVAIAFVLFFVVTVNRPLPPKPVSLKAPSPKAAAPAPENAFTDFEQAAQSLVAPPRDSEFNDLLTKVWTGPWREDERLERYLTNNLPALALLDRGLHKAVCALPPYNPEVSPSYVEPLRELARLKSIRAKKALAQHDLGAAAGDGAQIVKFGDMVMRGGGPLIVYRQGIAIKHIGYDVLLQVLNDLNIDVATLKRLADDLAPFEEDNGALDQALNVEYEKNGAWLLSAASHENFAAVALAFSGGQTSETVARLLGGPPTFKLAETSGLMDALFGLARYCASHPWAAHAALDKEMARVMAEPFDLRKESNVCGQVVLHLLLDQVPPTLVHQRRIETEAAAVRALLALLLYQREHGELPEALNEAMPELPLDPFSDGPLRYSKERALVWSVGSGGLDLSYPVPIVSRQR